MTKELNYGTNVEVTTTDHSGKEETISLVVERELKETQPDNEETKFNPCLGCYFYNNVSGNPHQSLCNMSRKDYENLGTCYGRIFVRK